MEDLRRTYAAPGARTTDVEDDFLVEGMKELDEQTREKNREFSRRISDLIARRKRTAERLQEEAGERTEEIARIRADFEESVKRTVAQLTAEIDEEFDRIEQSSYEPMVAHLDQMERDFDRWATEDVPAVIEAETGAVVRYLSQTQESFEIENAKIRKREESLEDRFAEHRRNAQSLAEAEREKRADRFWALEEDMAAQFAREHRSAPRRENRVKHALAGVRSELKQERETREGRDVEVLSTLTDSMAALQQTVLDNFGANSALQE